MKPIYVSRKLIKTDEFIYWMESNNIIDMIPENELHLTVAYSKKSVAFESLELDHFMLLIPKHNRKLKLFGNSLVLSVSSNYLNNRWKYYLDNGCSWDFPEYQPHISLSYNYKNLPKDIEPFYGDILLGQEILEDLDEGDNDE